MQRPPSPMSMYTGSPSSKGKNKRAIDESPPATDRPQQPSKIDSNAPRILRRYQHRRRNVATEVWGPEIPSTTSPRAFADAPAPKQPFSVYKAILRHPNLFFQFALRLRSTMNQSTRRSVIRVTLPFAFLPRQPKIQDVAHSKTRFVTGYLWTPSGPNLLTHTGC